MQNATRYKGLTLFQAISAERRQPQPSRAMLTPTDIAEYGERHVEKWLTEYGYRCHHTRQRHGTKDLEAISDENNMLVHVNASLEPKSAPDLTQTDHDSICSRAMMLGFEPWMAQLQVDRYGDLFGDIVWTKLK